MGITERHWFEDEEPELSDYQLEEIAYEKEKAYKSGYVKGYYDAESKVVELTERQLQDAVEERETARIDIPGTSTIKIKKQIPISATRCIVCGKWECPEFNHELYEAIIMGETTGICESCRKAVLWAKEHMNDSN